MIKLYNDTKEISIIKKDTVNFKVSITNYNLTNGDSLIFGIKKSLNDTTYLLKKTITTFNDGKAEINLSDIDTNINPGSYIYGLKLIRTNNKDTLISDGYAVFTIKEGVINE